MWLGALLRSCGGCSSPGGRQFCIVLFWLLRPSKALAAIGLPLELCARTLEASLSSGHGEVLAGDMSARWWANMGEHG